MPVAADREPGAALPAPSAGTLAARLQGGAAIDDRGFARLIAAVGPFEPAPEIAVAVSGGADSLCLALLLSRWLTLRGGRMIGLTVDHGLRPESAREAASVGRRLADWGVAHHVLRWQSANDARGDSNGDPGRNPGGNIQARARAARYRLMTEWCRAHGVLHLAVGHHRDDQAETVAYRMEHGAGKVGLAGMATVSARHGVRLIRPLLPVSRNRTEATLRAAAMPWLDDPSNRDPRFARTGIRARLAAAAAMGDPVAGLARILDQNAAERARLEQGVAELLAKALRPRAEGYAWLDAGPLGRVAGDIAVAALRHLIRTIAGSDHPPSRAGCDRLLRAILAFEQARGRGNGGGGSGGRTIGGCRLLRRRAGWLVCREAAAMAPSVPVAGDRSAVWDGRFRAVAAGPTGPDWRLGAVGRHWPALRRHRHWPALRRHRSSPVARAGAAAALPFPDPVGPTLPALYDLDGILAVPHLSLWRPVQNGAASVTLRFSPPVPFAGISFRPGVWFPQADGPGTRGPREAAEAGCESDQRCRVRTI